MDLPVEQGGNPRGSPWRGGAVAQVGLCGEGVTAEVGGANNREWLVVGARTRCTNTATQTE